MDWGVGDGGGMDISHISAELDRLQREINQLRAEVRVASKAAPATPPQPVRIAAATPPTPASAPAPILLQQLKSNARDPWRPAIPEMSTTKLLAWAGGGITVLGLVFLLALAASRGWITPTMRLAAGTLVSSGLIGASLWLHRRHGKLEAVMASGAAGIAGLYATLAAATIVYHDLSQPRALAGASGIALLAIAVALVIDGEELAAFGVSAAMLAPLLVTGTVTAAGVMFAAIMAATAPVLLARCGWHRMPVATWFVAAPLVYVMLGQAPPRAGLWTAAAVLLGVVWAVETYQFGLAGKAPRSLDVVTGGLASSVAGVLAATAFQAGHGHQLLGGDEAGWLLLAVAAALGAGACVPRLSSRSNPDLTDLLGGYALAACATGFGLLLHGPALVLAWGSEAAALAIVSERVGLRFARGVRLYAAATAYLVLAAGAALYASLPELLVGLHRWDTQNGTAAVAVLLPAVCVWTAVTLRSVWTWRRWAIWAPPAVVAYGLPLVLSGDAVLVGWTMIAAVPALATYSARLRRVFGRLEPLSAAATLLTITACGAAVVDRLAYQVVHHGGRHGVIVAVCLTVVSAVTAFGIPGRRMRTFALVPTVALAAVVAATLLPGAWAVTAWALIVVAIELVVILRPGLVDRYLDRRLTIELSMLMVAGLIAVGVLGYETAARLFAANPAPAAGIAPLIATVLAAWLLVRAAQALSPPVRPFGVTLPMVVTTAAALTLWTVSAAILGVAELAAANDSQLIHDRFQDGHVAVSICWGVTGLALLYLGLRRGSRTLRTAGVVLLFATPFKLFLYDLSFLTSTSRAASFIVTGLALIAAALVMQRLTPSGENAHTRSDGPAGVAGV